MNKSIVIVIVIIGLVLGFGSGYLVGQKTTASSYEAQITKAKAFFPQLTDVRSVSGTVKSVSGNSVTVSTISSNPFDDSPSERVVTIGDKTTIVENTPKDPKVFQQEMAAYQASIKNIQPVAVAPAAGAPAAPSIATPPTPFTEQTINLSDLKAGMQITVQASANIKTAATFEAVSISVSPVITPPTGTIPLGAAPAVVPKP